MIKLVEWGDLIPLGSMRSRLRLRFNRDGLEEDQHMGSKLEHNRIIL